jgi:DNA-binding MarR family transcriptional regulator
MKSKSSGEAGAIAASTFDLNEFLPYRMLVVTNKVTQVFAVRYKQEFGITVPESRVINVLGRNSPLSSWEICEQTTMNKTRVSVAITNLVNTGIVAKEIHPVDQRQLNVTLTKKGEALRKKMVVIALEMERQIIVECGATGRRALMDLLSRIERDAERISS